MQIVPVVLLVLTFLDQSEGQLAGRLQSEMFLKKLISALSKTNDHTDENLTVQRNIFCGRSVKSFGIVTENHVADMRTVHLIIARKMQLRECKDIFILGKPKTYQGSTKEEDANKQESISVRQISFIAPSLRHKNIFYGLVDRGASFSRLLVFNNSNEFMGKELQLKERGIARDTLMSETSIVYGATTGKCPSRDNTMCILAAFKKFVRCYKEPRALQTGSNLEYTDVALSFPGSRISSLALDDHGFIYMTRRNDGKIFMLNAKQHKIKTHKTIRSPYKFKRLYVMKGGSKRLSLVFLVSLENKFYLLHLTDFDNSYIGKRELKLLKKIQISDFFAYCWMRKTRKIVAVSKTYPFEYKISQMMN